MDDTEAERLLIANTLLRRQITDPMAKARLIARLNALTDVKPGPPIQVMGNNSALSAELAAKVCLKERQARKLNNLTKLIPELQALVSEERLIADTLPWRQITDPMAKARLIARLKE